MDFDSLPADTGAQAPSAGTQPNTAAPTPSFDELPDDNAKYGTPGQQLGAGLEGVARGVIPGAPYLEKHLLRIPGQDIEGRREANPITSGAGEVAGLAGSALAGTEAAQAVTGLGGAAKEASYGFKVGSATVKQAAEMAAIQGNEEANKMLMNDPNTSAEHAIANVGLTAALGGVGGAAFAGAINPLWEATAGPQVEKVLSAFKNHLDGRGAVLPEDLANALKANNIEMPPVMKAAASGDASAMQKFNELREAQHPEIIKALEDLHQANAHSVMNALGVTPESIASFSESENGQAIRDTFQKEYKAKYEPIQQQMEKRNTEAAGISVPDTERLGAYGRMVEQGMKLGTDSPYYKLYEDWGNRILAKDTIGGMDTLKTELSGDINKAFRTGDTNTSNALKDIRKSIADFQENQIAKQGVSMEKAGMKGAQNLSTDLLNERATANRNYAEFAGMSDQLMDHLGVGDFKGAGGLSSKLKDLSPEQIASKFSPKGNVESIPFLAKHFPETLQAVQQNETNKVIKPAVQSALKKGDIPIDYNKLHDVVTKGMQGSPEYTKFAIPQRAIDAIQNAKTISNAIPAYKSSGTAGWMTKMFAHLPTSALAAVAFVSGHNPLLGAMAGELAQKLGRDVPDAYKLSMLKFLASEQPAKAGGFKSMLEFMHNTMKGENLIAKATTNVFKPGAQVLASNQLPNQQDRDKLDKQVTGMQNNPEQLLNTQTQSQLGHYMPQHQQAMGQTTTTQLQYLQQLQPKSHATGPLDRPVEPSAAEKSRYNRALDIAQQPTIVMQHCKDGTLQASDVIDLKTMYPGVYQSMVTKMSNALQSTHADEEQIPYKTRLCASLFLGQPLDSSMQPSSILAAQPQPKAPPPQGPVKGGGKSMKSLGKSNNSYKTTTQEAESDRSNRD